MPVNMLQLVVVLCCSLQLKLYISITASQWHVA